MKIGIDVGSTGIKIVFVKNEVLAWKKVIPTRPGQSSLVEELVREGVEACKIKENEIEYTSVTGYGRNLIESSDHVVDEIWANAASIHKLSGGKARTLINVGGQDVKIICMDHDGRVTDFKMNDKCAAGTGRFYEIAANILDTPLEQFYIEDQVESVAINATCAVFAESEIVSLLAAGVDKRSIIKGINGAVAKRIASLAGRSLLAGEIFVDGGPAKNLGLIQSLEDAMMCDVHVTDEPQFTVALGALLVD